MKKFMGNDLAFVAVFLIEVVVYGCTGWKDNVFGMMIFFNVLLSIFFVAWAGLNLKKYFKKLWLRKK